MKRTGTLSVATALASAKKGPSHALAIEALGKSRTRAGKMKLSRRVHEHLKNINFLLEQKGALTASERKLFRQARNELLKKGTKKVSAKGGGLSFYERDILKRADSLSPPMLKELLKLHMSPAAKKTLNNLLTKKTKSPPKQIGILSWG